tara:strand:+ start:172 stop:504 length:333 start_codon:yes stop_codon:yes gene_type:complete
MEENSISENKENNYQTQSVYNLIQLINICQNRGCFNLDEASELYKSVKNFDKGNKDNVTKEDQKNSIVLFINSINKAQKHGLLELEEAHLAWECIQSFTKKDEIDISQDL